MSPGVPIDAEPASGENGAVPTFSVWTTRGLSSRERQALHRAANWKGIAELRDGEGTDGPSEGTGVQYDADSAQEAVANISKATGIPESDLEASPLRESNPPE